MKLHPAIESQLSEVLEFEQLARQYLTQHQIAIDDAAYKKNKQSLFANNGLVEFFKAWQFESGMINTRDYPDGILEKDVKLAFRKEYPTLAAIGIIEIAKDLKALASKISANGAATIEDCLDYATLFWRIKLLGNVMAIKNIRRRAVSDKQAERRKRAGENTRLAVLEAAKAILDDPKQRPSVTRPGGGIIVARLWASIEGSYPDIAIKKSQGMSILRDLISEHHIG
jgi:hypothetical protein